MGEWIPSSVTEVKLHSLVAKGLRPPKEVAGWRAPDDEAAPYPQPGEVVSFTDFDKCWFVIPASNFLRGFFYEHGVQLHHLPPNAVL
jgi:hypothetical protein